ncbi:MAG: hypothetical protein CL920_33985 [Deltaproteobacteria bacterium]|nr:hypothetical protein [Deltaproteobacteria bacterium]MBU53733.1 hypothetical protein [Deltaproteobacteria bacterium]
MNVMLSRVHLYRLICVVCLLFTSPAMASKPSTKPDTSEFNIGTTKKRLHKEQRAAYLLAMARSFYEENRRALAARYLEQLLIDHPKTAAAEQATALWKKWKVSEYLILPGEARYSSGAAEWISFSGVYGLALGIAVPMLLAPYSQVGVLLGFLGLTSLGIVSSALVSLKWKLTSGMASLITNLTIIGTWTGAWIANAMRLYGSAVAVPAILLSLTGYISGIVISRLSKPDIHQISFASSTAWWSTFLLSAFYATAADNFITIPQHVRSMSSMLILGAGFLGGLFLHQFTKFSRMRMFLINAGGLAGLGLGFAVTAPFTDLTSPTPRIPGTLILATVLGSIAGVLLTGALTQHFYPAPRQFGKSNSIIEYTDGRWKMGAPLPGITVASTPSGQWAPQFNLSILSGKW